MRSLGIRPMVRRQSYQDFSSKEEDENGFVREIYEINVEQNNDLVVAKFIGNGFMRYQIRNMIGTAITVASGKENLSFIDYHLKEDKVREIVSYKAPACGLYLIKVVY